jgi:hypothetical protein
MPCTDGTSWNNKRLRGVTEGFQVSEHSVEPQRDVPKHVLTNEPSGPRSLDNVASCRPEPAVIILASPLPGEGFRLARVTGADDGASPMPGKRISISDVSVIRNSGESFGEDAAGVWLNFSEPNGAESCPLCGDGEAPNPRE